METEQGVYEVSASERLDQTGERKEREGWDKKTEKRGARGRSSWETRTRSSRVLNLRHFAIGALVLGLGLPLGLAHQ